MPFGVIVCTTLNIDQRRQKSQLSEEISSKIIDKPGKGQGFKTISKPHDVSVTTVAHFMKKFHIHGAVAGLPGAQL